MVVLVVDDMQALEKSVGAMHQEMMKQMSEVQSSLATQMDLMLSRIDHLEDLLKKKQSDFVSPALAAQDQITTPVTVQILLLTQFMSLYRLFNHLISLSISLLLLLMEK